MKVKHEKTPEKKHRCHHRFWSTNPPKTRLLVGVNSTLTQSVSEFQSMCPFQGPTSNTGQVRTRCRTRDHMGCPGELVEAIPPPSSAQRGAPFSLRRRSSSRGPPVFLVKRDPLLFSPNGVRGSPDPTSRSFRRRAPPHFIHSHPVESLWLMELSSKCQKLNYS